MKKIRRKMLFLLGLMIVIGGMSSQMRVFANMGNPYSNEDMVNVDIVFEKEAIENSSIEEMIEKIENEVLQGEDLDVRKVMGAYQVNANILYGQMNPIRKVEGVKSVRVVSFAYPVENDTPQNEDTTEQGVQDATASEIEGSTQTNQEDESMDVNKKQNSSNSGWWIPLGAIGGALGAGFYYKTRKSDKKK